MNCVVTLGQIAIAVLLTVFVVTYATVLVVERLRGGP